MNKEEWRALVTECRASGMTARDWCRLKDIKYSRYCGWATKVNKETQETGNQEWVNIPIVKEAVITGTIKLHCGKVAISVEPGFNPGLLADILKVVHSIC